MSTLRNKTTESGVIIRWQPHPNHSRPSTYQVTTRAVSFFQDLGYSVPHSGDECEVPSAICRPLRALGDLYFKSEQPGKVDMTSLKKRSSLGKGLKIGQRQKMHTYIESHPQYTGTAKRSLHSEVSKLPQESDKGQAGRTEHKSTKLASTKSPPDSLLPASDIYIGQIDRISNGGNAIVKSEKGREINIGPLSKSTVGEWTLAIDLHGPWRLCLTPQLWNGEYRDLVRRRGDEFGEWTGLNAINSLLQIYDYKGSVDGFSSSIVEVTILTTRKNFGVAYKGPHTILVEGDYLLPGQRINVEIVGEYERIMLTQPIVDADDSIIGESRDVKIVGRRANVAIGATDGHSVIIPGENAQKNDTLKVGIADINPGYYEGSLAALPSEELPTQGDPITVRKGRAVDSSIPVRLPADTPNTEVEFQLGVASVESDYIRASLPALNNANEFTPDEEYVVSVQEWEGDVGIAVKDKIPIRITDGRRLAVENVRIRIDQYAEECIEASFLAAVVDESIESIDQARNRASEYLADHEFDEAVEATTLAYEFTSSSDVKARFACRRLEILAQCGQALENQDFDHATRILDTALGELKHSKVAPNVCTATKHELRGYRHTLQGAKLWARAETTDDQIKATEYRSRGKHVLDKAASSFDSLASTPKSSLHTQQKPHSVIQSHFVDIASSYIIITDSTSRYCEAFQHVESAVDSD